MISNQKIICLAVELNVIKASAGDITLSRHPLSLQCERESSVNSTIQDIQVLDANHSMAVGLETPIRPSVP
jgi:hypothetical protein